MIELDRLNMLLAENAVKRRTVDRVQKRVRGYIYERLHQHVLPEVSDSGTRLHERTFRCVSRWLNFWWRF